MTKLMTLKPKVTHLGCELLRHVLQSTASPTSNWASAPPPPETEVFWIGELEDSTPPPPAAIWDALYLLFVRLTHPIGRKWQLFNQFFSFCSLILVSADQFSHSLLKFWSLMYSRSHSCGLTLQPSYICFHVFLPSLFLPGNEILS